MSTRKYDGCPVLNKKFFTLVEGVHKAILLDYKVSNYMSGTKIRLRLQLDLTDGHEATDILPEGRWEYFWNCMTRQFNRQFDCLGDILEHAKTHEFIIEYRDDKQWGPQFSYRG